MEAAVELADPRPDDHVLDVATGTGAVLRALARLPSRPSTVTGLDKSDEMLARVPSLPVGWSVARGHATRLPFQAARFDVVFASYVLHLLGPPTLRRALGEMRRVTKPGGRVVTVTPVAPRSCLARPYELTVAALAQLSEGSLGLRGMDPRQELVRHGFEPDKARYVHGGYPSLCATRRSSGRRNGCRRLPRRWLIPNRSRRP